MKPDLTYTPPDFTADSLKKQPVVSLKTGSAQAQAILTNGQDFFISINTPSSRSSDCRPA